MLFNADVEGSVLLNGQASGVNGRLLYAAALYDDRKASGVPPVLLSVIIGIFESRTLTKWTLNFHTTTSDRDSELRFLPQKLKISKSSIGGVNVSSFSLQCQKGHH